MKTLFRNQEEEERSLKMEDAEDGTSPESQKSSTVPKENSAPKEQRIDMPADDAHSDTEDEQAESPAQDEYDELMPSASAPRMHVMVAITATFAWIFLCAGLFRLWENWTYWDSLYFMFISLLTVGLGDVNVERRDLV